MGKYEILCLENARNERYREPVPARPLQESKLTVLLDPLLDIQAVDDGTLLKKYDLKSNDAILAEEKHMALYDDLFATGKADLNAGGAAQNTARGAQYILPADSVVFIGCVGKDKYADHLVEANKKVGLHTVYRYDDKQPTGRCGVIITGHDRSMCTDLAAANCYKVEHLKENWELVKQAKIYFVGGYHLTVSVPAILALAEEAAAANKVFMLSLSAPFICQFFKDQLDETSPYWDYVVGNETEARAFAAAHDLDTEDIPTIAKHMANLPKKNTQRKRTVIVTQGTEPTVVAIQGDDKVQEFPVHVIDKSEITDTTGAGDAFAGGFLAAIAKGESLTTAVNQGQWLAKLSIKELGPAYPFPKQTYSA